MTKRRSDLLRGPVRLGLAALALASLAACEVRRDGAEPDPAASDDVPAGTPSGVAMGTPGTPTEGVEAGESIIRDDIEEAPSLVEVPPEPVDVTIPFPDGGTDLSPDAQRLLALVVGSDAMKQGWPIVLGGHTDSAGNDRANLRASRARAEAVAAWLVERGVDDERIEVIAFGEQNPIARNARPDGEPDEAGRARNRRVQISITAPQPMTRSTPAPAASGTKATGQTN